MNRRPSFATVVALLALFVALGGPAQAARLITGGDVKDRSLKTRDLSRKTVRALKTPRDNTVTEAKIVNGAVTRAKLAPSAVASPTIADGGIAASDLAIASVTGRTIADGSLTARELGRFYGRFRLAEPIMVESGECWSGVPSGLPAERARVDISQDLVLVTPDATWPQDRLSLTVKTEPPTPKPGRFTLSACNFTGQDTPAFTPSFRYLIVDVP